jgi:uncharacterized membrane protein YdbT with pleckstrin-like domain
MSERFKEIVLRWMRVPPEPHPPAGSATSVKVFRASPRLYQLNLVRWAVSQAATLVGFFFALGFLHIGMFGAEAFLERVPHSELIPPLILIAEVLGIAFFVVQLPVTFFMVRLDYEMRWYIVTDRSLRIREGIWKVNEMTLTFANVQEVSIHQGPLQRLLGISDLRVRTAGGGAGSGPPAKQHQQEKHDGHLGHFHGVDNAEEIRDLIRERLSRLRDAGLGDPDQAAEAEGPDGSDLLDAARGLLAEVRALRRVAVG